MNFKDYQRLHYAFFKVLVLQLTLKCPLECDHCNVNAGPTRKESLPVEVIEESIESFVRTGQAELVFLTGGEPFTARVGLRAALLLCEKYKLKSYIITSANWAHSDEVAKELLNSMPHISLLSVSADRWHHPFVSLLKIRSAVSAALSRKIAVNIALTLEDPLDNYQDKIRDVLGTLWERVDVSVTMLRKVGRSQNGWDIPKREIPLGYCARIGTPVVTVDGSVCACCCATETNLISQVKNRPNSSDILDQADGNPKHALFLGRAGQTSFMEVKNKLEDDPLLAAIRYLGPGWIYERALQRNMDLGPDTEFRDICDVCATLVRDSDRSNLIRQILRSPELIVQIERVKKVHAEVSGL